MQGGGYYSEGREEEEMHMNLHDRTASPASEQGAEVKSTLKTSDTTFYSRCQ